MIRFRYEKLPKADENKLTWKISEVDDDEKLMYVIDGGCCKISSGGYLQINIDNIWMSAPRPCWTRIVCNEHGLNMLMYIVDFKDNDEMSHKVIKEYAGRSKYWLFPLEKGLHFRFAVGKEINCDIINNEEEGEEDNEN